MKAASDHLNGDPMKGTSAYAPKPRKVKVGDWLALSLDEVFDLAEAISCLGPLMSDGRSCGARLESLVLACGTTGGRRGEYVAHQPEWFDWEKGNIISRESEGAAYGDELWPWERGLQVGNLKRREEDEFREVLMISEVQGAIH